MEQRQRHAKQSFEQTQKPFKGFEKVEKWKDQYKDENAKGLTRFKLLILKGIRGLARRGTRVMCSGRK